MESALIFVHQYTGAGGVSGGEVNGTRRPRPTSDIAWYDDINTDYIMQNKGYV